MRTCARCSQLTPVRRSATLTMQLNEPIFSGFGRKTKKILRKLLNRINCFFLFVKFLKLMTSLHLLYFRSIYEANIEASMQLNLQFLVVCEYVCAFSENSLKFHPKLLFIIFIKLCRFATKKSKICNLISRRNLSIKLIPRN